MTERPSNDIIIEYLRHIDERTRGMQLEIEKLKSFANIHRNEISTVKRKSERIHQILSRIAEQLDRIEGRLDLKADR